MKGILFKPESIQAIVEGRKTVTRRVIKPQPQYRKGENYSQWVWSRADVSKIDVLMEGVDYALWWDKVKNPESMIQFARYQVGEVVYIKEAFEYVSLGERDPWKDRAIADGSFRRKPDGSPVTMCYKSDGYEIGADWLNPLFMSEWAARHFILIKDVRAERLQEITIKDCYKEGFTVRDLNPSDMYTRNIGSDYAVSIPARQCFIDLWDSINKAYPWESNPWVFRYEFEYKEVQ